MTPDSLSWGPSPTDLLEAAALRARLAVPASPSSVCPTSACAEPESPAPGGGKPSAVLVAFLRGTEPGILLTRRTATLHAHAGQVAFPGGQIDPADPTPEAAALREAREEIGLAPARVELVGRLGEYRTGTGFRITPVVGVLPRGQDLPALGLAPSPAEVADVFELPLATLLDPSAPRRQRVKWRGAWREYWVWPHPQQYIWGATAAILVALAGHLRAAPLPSSLA